MKRLAFAVLSLLLNLEASTEASSGTVLIGHVTLTGAPPTAKTAEVMRDREYCGTHVPIESLVVDPTGKGVRGAVAEVEGMTDMSGTNPDSTPLVLNNRSCAFAPRIQASDTDHALEIRNEDRVMHNTHITHESRTFGTVLQAHQTIWGGSGLLGTLNLLKSLTWPSTLPVIALPSAFFGSQQVDFNQWAWFFTVLRTLVIATASIAAYRIIFVGGGQTT